MSVAGEELLNLSTPQARGKPVVLIVLINENQCLVGLQHIIVPGHFMSDGIISDFACRAAQHTQSESQLLLLSIAIFLYLKTGLFLKNKIEILFIVKQKQSEPHMSDILNRKSVVPSSFYSVFSYSLMKF